MVLKYSRLTRVETSKNLRSVILFGALSVILIILLLFVGLPVLAKFAGFLADIRSSSLPVEKNDTTPPAPPQLNPLPEFTKESQVLVEGKTEEGATVTIFVNDTQKEVVADNQGQFSLKVKLSKGQNTVYVKAKDKSGNESAESKKLTITFDNEAPSLEISEPADGSAFYGPRQKQVNIKGVTDPEANLTINDRIVSLDDAGNFNYSFTLSEGQNTLNLKAVDPAGNTIEKSLSLTYGP